MENEWFCVKPTDFIDFSVGFYYATPLVKTLTLNHFFQFKAIGYVII